MAAAAPASDGRVTCSERSDAEGCRSKRKGREGGRLGRKRQRRTPRKVRKRGRRRRDANDARPGGPLESVRAPERVKHPPTPLPPSRPPGPLPLALRRSRAGLSSDLGQSAHARVDETTSGASDGALSAVHQLEKLARTQRTSQASRPPRAVERKGHDARGRDDAPLRAPCDVSERAERSHASTAS